MPPVTNCASYIDIEAQFVTVKGIKRNKPGTSTRLAVNFAKRLQLVPVLLAVAPAAGWGWAIVTIVPDRSAYAIARGPC